MSIDMTEKKEIKNKPLLNPGETLQLDLDRLKNMTSGSCIIQTGEVGKSLAVCRDGDMIKIFKIVEEK